MVKYEEAIKKPFTDVVKLVIGIILSFIPIVSWVAKGFTIECSGLGKTKPSAKMPEWGNWWHLFVRGLLSDIIFLIYAIPAILVILAVVGVAISSLWNTYIGTVIPPQLLASVKTGETSPEVIGQLISQNWALAIPTLISLTPGILAAVILLLLALYLTPMAVLNYVKNDRFGAAFDLGVVFKKALTGKYFIVWLAVVVLTAVITLILSLIPLIGPAAAVFIVGVIAYSLYGQVYKEV
jgi:hypothetical protein